MYRIQSFEPLGKARLVTSVLAHGWFVQREQVAPQPTPKRCVTENQGLALLSWSNSSEPAAEDRRIQTSTASRHRGAGVSATIAAVLAARAGARRRSERALVAFASAKRQRRRSREHRCPEHLHTGGNCTRRSGARATRRGQRTHRRRDVPASNTEPRSALR